MRNNILKKINFILALQKRNPLVVLLVFLLFNSGCVTYLKNEYQGYLKAEPLKKLIIFCEGEVCTLDSVRAGLKQKKTDLINTNLCQEVEIIFEKPKDISLSDGKFIRFKPQKIEPSNLETLNLVVSILTIGIIPARSTVKFSIDNFDDKYIEIERVVWGAIYLPLFNSFKKRSHQSIVDELHLILSVVQ